MAKKDYSTLRTGALRERKYAQNLKRVNVWVGRDKPLRQAVIQALSSDEASAQKGIRMVNGISPAVAEVVERMNTLIESFELGKCDVE